MGINKLLSKWGWRRGDVHVSLYWPPGRYTDVLSYYSRQTYVPTRGKTIFHTSICTVTGRLQAASQDFSLSSLTSGLIFPTLYCRGPRNSAYI